jgi:hypothetical protein
MIEHYSRGDFMQETNSLIADQQAIIKALDNLALALVEHKHQWTTSDRGLYEKAIRILS